jgi:hypothetical protein
MRKQNSGKNLNVCFFTNIMAWFLLLVFQRAKKVKKEQATRMEANHSAKQYRGG